MKIWFVALATYKAENRSKNTVTLPITNYPVSIIMLQNIDDVGYELSSHYGYCQSIFISKKPIYTKNSDDETESLET